MCSFLVWKNTCLSAQSFIEYDIVVMNEWKKKCVGLQRTWVSKRTVRIETYYRSKLSDINNTVIKKDILGNGLFNALRAIFLKTPDETSEISNTQSAQWSSVKYNVFIWWNVCLRSYRLLMIFVWPCTLPKHIRGMTS